jgi:putative spermidine/putrescine transport system ATP-binding protein
MTPESTSPRTEIALSLHGLRKQFADATAVDGVDLEVRRGEFLTLLGPSGSGKTTTLRMIAGFTLQDSGSIEIGGEDVSRIPPYRRDVGMVFQNYALFPHMTAAQNVAFPLQMRRMSRDEQRRRVDETLGLVKLERLGDRYPRQLSGGQQQRVALARAVVFGPRLLLMDEPLGALDKKLRESLQLEILRISRQLGATVIYVTHDQEEALAMSDRIAILNLGRVEQLGNGEDLYERPASLFVADFIGESNILHGQYSRDGTGGVLVSGSSAWRVGSAALSGRAPGDGTAALVLRPEHLRVEAADQPADPGRNSANATVSEVLYLGATRKIQLVLADGRPAVGREGAASGRAWHAGDQVRLTWAPSDGVLVSDESH